MGPGMRRWECFGKYWEPSVIMGQQKGRNKEGEEKGKLRERWSVTVYGINAKGKLHGPRSEGNTRVTIRGMEDLEGGVGPRGSTRGRGSG